MFMVLPRHIANMNLDDLPTPEFEGTVHPDELHSDGDNPNEMSEEMFDHLCDRIENRGWVGNAIITDTEGVIADGEHRWQAAQNLGLEEVPVKQYDLTRFERKLIRQEMNKISGEHDPERDAYEFERIIGSSEQSELEDLLSARDEELDDFLEEDYEEYDGEDDYELYVTTCPNCGHEFQEW